MNLPIVSQRQLGEPGSVGRCPPCHPWRHPPPSCLAPLVDRRGYPLVNVYTLRTGKLPSLNGKITINRWINALNGWCSISTLVYQRVCTHLFLTCHDRRRWMMREWKGRPSTISSQSWHHKTHCFPCWQPFFLGRSWRSLCRWVSPTLIMHHHGPTMPGRRFFGGLAQWDFATALVVSTVSTNPNSIFLVRSS
jgi:hypothetical protein